MAATNFPDATSEREHIADLERRVEAGRQFRLRMTRSPNEPMNIALSVRDLSHIGFALRQLSARSETAPTGQKYRYKFLDRAAIDAFLAVEKDANQRPEQPAQADHGLHPPVIQCVYRTGCETPNDCRDHGYCRSPKHAAPQGSPGSISGEAQSRIEAVPASAAPSETTQTVSLSGLAPRLYGSGGTTGSLGPFGILLFADPNLPDDTMEFRDAVTGRVLAKIINVGKA